MTTDKLEERAWDWMEREHQGRMIGNTSAFETNGAEIIRDLLAENARLKARADMLDYIEHETLDLRCHNVPTGGNDYDVGWTVTRHHMDKPTERVIGQGFSVASAISAAQTPPEKQGEA